MNDPVMIKVRPHEKMNGGDIVELLSLSKIRHQADAQDSIGDVVDQQRSHLPPKLKSHTT